MNSYVLFSSTIKIYSIIQKDCDEKTFFDLYYVYLQKKTLIFVTLNFFFV